ncbi:hypothetical protein BKA70DRAFT_1554396 [Coprinopsis sp. MPI-PUGE-AT-0042]|nr:hypothetical protein BKA70DRAFT_1554396 [Coprinopsis sp. MPI-PUGE-AT-0042]
MSAILASFWSHPYGSYSRMLTVEGTSKGGIVDDFVSVIFLSLFTVVQARFCLKILRRVFSRRKGEGQTSAASSFAVISVMLFALYLPGALLLVATIVHKISNAPFSPYPNNALLVMETMCGGLFQLIIFLGDGLLLYRCYIVFSDAPIVYVTGILVYVVSAGISIAVLVYHIATGKYSWARRTSLEPVNPWNIDLGNGSIIPSPAIIVLSAGSSVLVNLIVTISIASRIFLAKRQTKRLWNKLSTSYTHRSSYGTAIAILLEAAVPPAIVGMVVTIVAIPLETSAARSDISSNPRSLRVLWVSLMCLAPQLIAIRVSNKASWDRQSDKVSRSIAFAHPRTSATDATVSSFQEAGEEGCSPSVSLEHSGALPSIHVLDKIAPFTPTESSRTPG